MKILIDTDIGSDIDDALCLSYLLSREDVQIVGISTTSGRPEERAALASAVTTFYGRDVPICIGSAQPLSGEQRQSEAPQAAVLADWTHSPGFRDVPVEDFMHGIIASSPGEVALLAIGPLTNVARMMQRYPQSVTQLSRMVCMSGRFSDYQNMADVPEWNVLCDVEAARICYEAGSSSDLLLVSSDVTRRLAMDKATAGRALSRLSDRLGPVAAMSRIWFANRAKMTIHDGLAAALLFEPDLCEYKSGQPVLDGPSATTSWKDDQSSPVRATATVDENRFFEHFFRVLETA